MTRHTTDRVLVSEGHGWDSSGRSTTPRRAIARRMVALLILVPVIAGLFGAPAVAPARGDELSDAKAHQAQIKKDIAEQKAEIQKLNDMQAGLTNDIQQTTAELKGIGADLNAVKVRISKMQTKINGVKTQYNNLVRKLARLDATLRVVEAQEVAKKQELGWRKDLLAQRIRDAYDTDRTSLLETLVAGGTFTDLLAEMSYYIDIGTQDKALAEQIAKDQETLAEMHQTTQDTVERTNQLRQATAAQKRALDKSLVALKEAKAELKRLEAATARALATQKAVYKLLLRNKAKAKAALAKAARAQTNLTNQIAAIIRKQAQSNGGRIPSQFNGTLAWPMAGQVTQNFGCTGFSWEPPNGSCAHYHNGIDMVAPYGTAVKASAAGTVVYCGWNYADGADPAWIVIVAHSQGLQTWYAHMSPSCPAPNGSSVTKGEVIGHEGNTGHSTGAHLHWGVYLNGNFVNPRLFL